MLDSEVNLMSSDIRIRLVEVALAWQERFGVAPAITSAISEYDASRLVGMTEDEYCSGCKNRTAVTRGYDFEYNQCRYQVKANRPSGKPGSPVTLVGKARNFEWDKLIWILYDKNYDIQEAWEWPVEEYRAKFESTKRMSPKDVRGGRCLYHNPAALAARPLA
jgi:hypothetical protein